MKFVIHANEFGGVVDASWTLQRNDGSYVCQNAIQEDGHNFRSEKAARADIAAAKTSMKGARFAKVEVES